MNTSKGESHIIDILNKEKIPFVREKCYADLKRNGIFFRYDFYLPEQNILCEVDGIQHFQEAWGGRKELMHRQENDRKKNSYALSQNIPLYRIPYWELSNIQRVNDIFQDKYKVISKWHNDRISSPEK